MSTDISDNSQKYEVTFGQWLASQRKMTQRDMAQELGVHYSTISLWESDKKLPKLNPVQLGRYLKLLDVDVVLYVNMCFATSPILKSKCD